MRGSIRGRKRKKGGGKGNRRKDLYKEEEKGVKRKGRLKRGGKGGG